MARPKCGTRFDAYKITCSVTGMAYIGATAQGVGKRFYQHMSRADNPAGEEFTTFLSHAVRKHGAEAFSVEHIASARTFDDLLELEKLLIEQHGTLRPGGYNSTMGGAGALGFRRSPTEAERENVRAKLTGRKLTEAHKQAIADGMRAIMTDERRAAVSVFHLGRKRPKETGAAISVGLRGKWKSATARSNASAAKATKAGHLSGTHRMPNGKWKAQAKINGKHRYLGVYETAELAHVAYLKAIAGK